MSYGMQGYIPNSAQGGNILCTTLILMHMDLTGLICW